MANYDKQVTSTERELEIFRESFHSVKVNVEYNFMTYKVRRGFAKEVAKQANELIEKLGLELVAIPTTLTTNDSFVVQSQYMP